MKTQHSMILSHLKMRKPITAMAAWENYGISKLATRVSEMIESGVAIEKRWITIQNRDGKDIRVMQYRLSR